MCIRNQHYVVTLDRHTQPPRHPSHTQANVKFKTCREVRRVPQPTPAPAAALQRSYSAPPAVHTGRADIRCDAVWAVELSAGGATTLYDAATTRLLEAAWTANMSTIPITIKGYAYDVLFDNTLPAAPNHTTTHTQENRRYKTKRTVTRTGPTPTHPSPAPTPPPPSFASVTPPPQQHTVDARSPIQKAESAPPTDARSGGGRMSLNETAEWLDTLTARCSFLDSISCSRMPVVG
jgi:hypothetical protein